MKKLNLGSGINGLADWINIDNSYNARLVKWPKLRYLLYKMGFITKDLYEVPWERSNIMIHDVRKKLPFDDGSFDYIYSSHLIEHLEKKEAEDLLRDCLRILKKNGIIRVVTPDLHVFATNYLKEYNQKKLKKQASENFLLGIGLLSDPKSQDPWYVKYLRADHQWLYDEKSLKELLEFVGFTKIERRKYSEGNVPDIQLLDNRPSTSLYMEAKKP